MNKVGFEKDELAGNSQGNLLTLQEAAEFLSISKWTLYKWTEKKLVPHHKVVNRRIYFFENELMAWIAGSFGKSPNK